MVQDAEDYTGYSEIGAVYGDVKIYTPSGLWVVGSDILSSIVSVGMVAPGGGKEETVVTLTGRGRIKSIGFWLYNWGAPTPADPFYDATIRIYIDGETTPSFEIAIEDLDLLNGYLAERKINLGIDVVTVTNPIGADTHDATTVKPVNQRGAVTLLVGDKPASGNVLDATYEACGFVNPDIEFFESARVAVYNESTNPSAFFMWWFAVEYGEYP